MVRAIPAESIPVEIMKTIPVADVAATLYPARMWERPAVPITGEADPRAIFKVEIAQMPGAENVSVGQQVYLQNRNGQPVPVKVIAKDEKTITFDANHEMAGKELNFRIELVEVR